ncbi:hypothetical protein ACLSY8_03955 [Avibacterium avium]|uniref:Lipoprotein n=2 Tax=Avibacterium TaxID=292486 RepID=A0A379AXA4_AVIGA|nr:MULTISPECIES: hypothetical protein [Avibacterium]POY44672.1 hypothetical protein C3007_05030 [Avibacterium gallinarum]TDP30467.1 hypothetical protein EV689_101503 [Avibacterium gallinarum]SUB26967.1 Uncharacterised protein [Avibacterium gallinarum]
MKKLLIILTVLSLASCAIDRPPSPRWYKDGASPSVVKAKYAKCTYDVGMNKVEPSEKITLINSCMEADGFIWGVPR